MAGFQPPGDISIKFTSIFNYCLMHKSIPKALYKHISIFISSQFRNLLAKRSNAL